MHFPPSFQSYNLLMGRWNLMPSDFCSPLTLIPLTSSDTIYFICSIKSNSITDLWVVISNALFSILVFYAFCNIYTCSKIILTVDVPIEEAISIHFIKFKTYKENINKKLKSTVGSLLEKKAINRWVYFYKCSHFTLVYTFKIWNNTIYKGCICV